MRAEEFITEAPRERVGRLDSPASARPADSMLDAPKAVRQAAARGANVSRDASGNYSAQTTNPAGVTTTTTADRVTTSSDAGTVSKDLSGVTRKVVSPRVGGLQKTQTFRPDATPGYDQTTYQVGPTTVSQKGSPETGYTKSAKFSAGPLTTTKTDYYSGQKGQSAQYSMGDTTIGQSQITDPRTGRTATTQTTTTAVSPTKRIQKTTGTTADGRTGTSTVVRRI